MAIRYQEGMPKVEWESCIAALRPHGMIEHQPAVRIEREERMEKKDGMGGSRRRGKDWGFGSLSVVGSVGRSSPCRYSFIVIVFGFGRKGGAGTQGKGPNTRNKVRWCA